MTRIVMIAAASQNNVIGNEGKIPWHIPEDLQRFKKLTMGYPMVMGRKTFESLPKQLPGRLHIVLTANKDWKPKCSHPHLMQIVYSVEELLEVIKAFHTVNVVGGGKIYSSLLPYADTIELTRVNAIYEGDAFFPVISSNDWNVDGFERKPHTKNDDGSHGPSYSFCTFKRLRNQIS